MMYNFYILQYAKEMNGRQRSLTYNFVEIVPELMNNFRKKSVNIGAKLLSLDLRGEPLTLMLKLENMLEVSLPSM